jgi:hypothetical protein
VANDLRWHPNFSRPQASDDARENGVRNRRWGSHRRWGLLLLALWLVPLVFAQNAPRVTSVEPPSGKVNDDVTLTGENLGKDSVANVFLSDAQDDFKATLVEQAEQKILVKIPKVKAGDYNLSIQVKDRIIILPVRFTVAE